MAHLALFQPDIPQNTGTILRLCACMGVGADVIEPCGFPFSDRHLRRAGMDYVDQVRLTRHADYAHFQSTMAGEHRRIVLLTTKATQPYTGFVFEPCDVLLLGRESAGVPEDVHKSVDARVTIPMAAGLRSLNVAVAAAMVLGEMLRQTGAFPQGIVDLKEERE